LVKRLMILAVVLAMAAAAAIPALAQDKERDSSNSGEDSGGSVVANPTPSTGGSEYDNVSYNANPADGSFEVSAAAPVGAKTSGSGSEVSVPAPTGGSDRGGCSDADKISLRSAPADNGGDDSGSVIAASTPGCSYVVIEE
jgi:hypothetical protein